MATGIDQDDTPPEVSSRSAPAEGAGEATLRPVGSAYDATQAPPRSARWTRTLRRRISWGLVALVALVWPYLYYGYCWLVWRTSRVEDDLTGPLESARARHGRVVALLWHQEVFTVAFAYRHLRGHTLASVGHFGRVITRMLELCNFRVFRGGSSTGQKRRRTDVLQAMVSHMRAEPDVIYGITVDGSNGPPYRMKPGGPTIARDCRAPIFLVRAWYARRIELPTWDRTAVPLPFNRIHLRAIGPYWIAPDEKGPRFEAARAHLEADLQELCWTSRREFEAHFTPRDIPGFPPDSPVPRWPAGALGQPRTPHDLRPDDPPAWAHRRGAGGVEGLSAAAAEPAGGSRRE